jgi:propionyl-CoA synthetase
MQKIADAAEWKMPATIEDHAVLDEIARALQAIGYSSAQVRQCRLGSHPTTD